MVEVDPLCGCHMRYTLSGATSNNGREARVARKAREAARKAPASNRASTLRGGCWTERTTRRGKAQNAVWEKHAPYGARLLYCTVGQHATIIMLCMLPPRSRWMWWRGRGK